MDGLISVGDFESKGTQGHRRKTRCGYSDKMDSIRPKRVATEESKLLHTALRLPLCSIRKDHAVEASQRKVAKIATILV